MMRRYQKGDAGAAMLVLMVILMAGWLWHGGSHSGHMSGSTSTLQTDKTALQLLDEAYARGDITREEYLRKRDDLIRP
jgi:putative membrane protein